MTLHYSSSLAQDYFTVFTIPASGSEVPPGLKEIIVEVLVAGRKIKRTLAPLPNQVAEIAWDNKDFSGQPFVGTTHADISIGFVYEVVYTSAGNYELAFGQPGGEPTSVISRQNLILWKGKSLKVNRPAENIISEGWTISEHHQMDPTDSTTLLKGDGSIVTRKTGIVDTVIGGGFNTGGEGQALDMRLGMTSALEIDAEGNIYVGQVDTPRVLKMDRTGYVTTVAGNGTYGFSGDGGSAVEAQLDRFWDLAIDDDGNMYIPDWNNHRIRKVDTNGIITTIAGTGSPRNTVDGGPATEASLYYPKIIEVDKAGNIYVVVSGGKIRKIDTNGIITTFYTLQTYDQIEAINFDPSGNMLLANYGKSLIQKIDMSTMEVTKIAGIIDPGSTSPVHGYNGDDQPAETAMLCNPSDLAIDEAGNIYIADTYNYRVRKIDTNGYITTIAGNGEYGYDGDMGIAVLANFRSPMNIIIDHFGDFLVIDQSSLAVRKINKPLHFSGDNLLFTEGNDLGYIISPFGRHERTIDLETGITLRSFGYDEENRLVSVTDQLNNITVIQRNYDGMPTAIVSPDGIVTTLTINANHHLTDITYEDGSFYNFDYTAGGLMEVEIDPNTNRFEHVFDPTGRLNYVLDEEGGILQYTKSSDASGRTTTTRTTAEGIQTIYEDQAFSTGKFVSTISGSDGSVTSFESSSDGLSAHKSLSCGMELDFKYDVDPMFKTNFVKETTQTSPSGLAQVTVRQKAYTDVNEDMNFERVTEIVTTNGKTTVMKNDVLLSQTTVTSPEGRTVTTYYDPMSLLTTGVSVPGLFDATYDYNSQGRLTDIWINTRHTSFIYNTRGFLQSITDPENHLTTYEYDLLGRVTAVHRSDTSDLYYGYDDNGNMTVLTNPSTVDHVFDYNKVNLQKNYNTPISGGYFYIYDKDRRLTQKQFPSGKTINWDYADPIDGNKSKLMKIITPEEDIDYTYLCGSKVASITKGIESITYGYDGKMVTSETLAGTLNLTLGYDYNNDFDVVAFTYAGDTEAYAYDLDGLLTGAGNFTIYRNAANGLPESVYDGTCSLTRSFNGYGVISGQQTTVNAQNAYQWDVVRDNNGRITQKTETIEGVTTVYGYDYDPMGRLERVTQDGVVVEEYQYDLNGTREHEFNSLRGITGRSFGYDDEDHLLTAGTASYQYDPDGFLTSKTDGTDTTFYNYSSRGELLSVTLPDNTLVEYVHDSLGRRIAKKINGTIIEKYLWEGLTTLLAVYDGTDNLLMRFEYADGRMPMAVEQEGVKYYLSYDQVGSLRLVADGVGNVIKRIDYDSFGNIIDDSNPGFAVPFAFAGGLYDKTTGLIRFGYRDYDPDLGRWTAKDPIFFDGGDTDLYGYVLNNPINRFDEKGLFDEETNEQLRNAAETTAKAVSRGSSATSFISFAEIAAGTGVQTMKMGKKDYLYYKATGEHYPYIQGSIIDWQDVDWEKYDQGTFEETIEYIYSLKQDDACE